ncbi:MAG: hypothetical protein AABZ31_01740 [Bdellovibrionota bacterium]
MKDLNNPVQNEAGGIAVPAIMWMAGVPLGLVLLIWLFFFRG